jgi:hypothetical protein
MPPLAVFVLALGCGPVEPPLEHAVSAANKAAINAMRFVTS